MQKKAAVMEADVDTAEGNLQEIMQQALDDFLINQKKLSLSKAVEVENAILERVDDGGNVPY